MPKKQNTKEKKNTSIQKKKRKANYHRLKRKNLKVKKIRKKIGNNI